MLTDPALLDGIRRSDNAVLERIVQEYRPRVVKQIVGQGGTGKRGVTLICLGRKTCLCL